MGRGPRQEEGDEQYRCKQRKRVQKTGWKEEEEVGLMQRFRAKRPKGSRKGKSRGKGQSSKGREAKRKTALMRARCKRGREIERAREDDTDEGREAANDEEKVICKRRAREYEQLAQMVLESQEDQTAMEPSLALLAALGISRPDFATNVLDKEGALHFHVIWLAVMGSIMAPRQSPAQSGKGCFTGQRGQNI